MTPSISIEEVANSIYILNRWGCPLDDIENILLLKKTTIMTLRSKISESNNTKEEIKISVDQIARVHIILEMNASLKMLFNNPDNIYGFMNKTNKNQFFNGMTPLEIIMDGNLSSLEQTLIRIKSLLSPW